MSTTNGKDTFHVRLTQFSFLECVFQKNQIRNGFTSEEVVFVFILDEFNFVGEKRRSKRALRSTACTHFAIVAGF